PPVSVSAVLQSIMPAPVFSRSSLTVAADIVIALVLEAVLISGGAPSGTLFTGELFRLTDPVVALDASLEVQEIVDPGDVFRRKRGDLIEAGDAEGVELAFEHRADAGDLLEVVGLAFRAGEASAVDGFGSFSFRL